jgi:hypothetical protein
MAQFVRHTGGDEPRNDLVKITEGIAGGRFAPLSLYGGPSSNDLHQPLPQIFVQHSNPNQQGSRQRRQPLRMLREGVIDSPHETKKFNLLRSQGRRSFLWHASFLQIL